MMAGLRAVMKDRTPPNRPYDSAATPAISNAKPIDCTAPNASVRFRMGISNTPPSAVSTRLCRDAGGSGAESGEGDFNPEKQGRQREAHDAYESDQVEHGGVSRDEKRRFSRYNLEERVGYRERGERENVEGLGR